MRTPQRAVDHQPAAPLVRPGRAGLAPRRGQPGQHLPRDRDRRLCRATSCAAGSCPTPGPDVSFTVFSAYPGNGEDSHSLGVLTLAEIEVDADGRFTLSVDPGPADGRRNHLQVKPGAKLLFVRDSMHDWSRESPIELEVTRLSGPPAAPIDESELARRAVADCRARGAVLDRLDAQVVRPAAAQRRAAGGRHQLRLCEAGQRRCAVAARRRRGAGGHGRSDGRCLPGLPDRRPLGRVARLRRATPPA